MYEIWNEEDLATPSPSYDPTIPAPSYAYLLQQTYTAIKQVCTSEVIVGGLASGVPSYLQDVINAFSPPGKFYFDGVGIHPYGRRPFNDWPNSSWGFGTITDLVKQYSDVVSGTLPIWVTEMGTNDKSVQGMFPFYAFESVNNQEPLLCPYFFWFCWSDGMVVSTLSYNE